MARNGSGTYVLPEAAFVPNTAISSAAVNSDLSDIADALTGSLARDGQGGMTAVLPMANAGFTYSTDPNTGMRRTGADTQAISCGAIDVLTATSTGISITGTLAVSGAFTVGGAPLLPIGIMAPWSGLTAPAKWLLLTGQTLLRASYPDLWTFASAEIALGNTLFTNGNGSTTFTIADLSGRIPAGKDNGTNRLTTVIPAANTLGATGGAQRLSLTAAEIPSITSRNATQAITVNPNGSATTEVPISSLNWAGVDVTVTAGAVGLAFSAGSKGSTHVFSGANDVTVTSNNTGSGAHDNVQPTIIVNYIIYAGV